MTLREMKPGEICTVSTIAEGDSALRSRIFDMGVTPGVKLKMIKTAPLGDPVEIVVRGYNLSLRKKEAEIINVTKE
jgi:ferrous iron transport protein A